MAREGQTTRPWYRWSPSDFLCDPAVAGMSREQRWRYRDALDFSWLSATPGVEEEAKWRSWLGVSESEWGAVREVYARAFVVSGGIWTQKRMLAEWEHATERSRQAADAGRKRQETGHRPLSGRSAVAEQTLSVRSADAIESRDSREIQSQHTCLTPLDVRDPGRGNGKALGNGPDPSPGFLRFWEGYRCQRRTGRLICLKLWVKMRLEPRTEEVMAALERYRRSDQWRTGYMPEPERWLKRTPWDDGPVTVERSEW